MVDRKNYLNKMMMKDPPFLSIHGKFNYFGVIVIYYIIINYIINFQQIYFQKFSNFSSYIFTRFVNILIFFIIL